MSENLFIYVFLSLYPVVSYRIWVHESAIYIRKLCDYFNRRLWNFVSGFMTVKLRAQHKTDTTDFWKILTNHFNRTEKSSFKMTALHFVANFAKTAAAQCQLVKYVFKKTPSFGILNRPSCKYFVTYNCNSSFYLVYFSMCMGKMYSMQLAYRPIKTEATNKLKWNIINFWYTGGVI